MADIPLDLQRRFEQRWAARFLRPAAPKKQGLERQDQQLTEPGKSKGKTRRTKSVGIRFCTVGVSAGPKPRVLVLVLRICTAFPHFHSNASATKRERETRDRSPRLPTPPRPGLVECPLLSCGALLVVANRE